MKQKGDSGDSHLIFVVSLLNIRFVCCFPEFLRTSATGSSRGVWWKHWSKRTPGVASKNTTDTWVSHASSREPTARGNRTYWCFFWRGNKTRHSQVVAAEILLFTLWTCFHAESEVCKLETLLQNEVSVVTAGEAVGADAAKTPPSLRRRKRTCSRRQGDKEKEREGGGVGPGDRGDRGVGEERDRREASELRRAIEPKPSWALPSVKCCPLVVLVGLAAIKRSS